jgi:biopolymer transport protein ExbB
MVLAAMGVAVVAPAAAQTAPGPDVPAPAIPTALPTGIATLPHDLSPWSMFLSAAPIVQGVMVGLALASVITWTVWLAKSVELRTMTRRTRQSLAAVSAARTLGEAARRISQQGLAADLVQATLSELTLSAELPIEGIKERVASRLERIEAEARQKMLRGTGILATIGATAPFVGLFGTVWGIMNSFIGISTAQTTNLAVVAPGIAEALLATACGLAAAIPAVVIYNVFARSIAGYRMLLADSSAAVLRLASRDLDRQPVSLAQAAE